MNDTRPPDLAQVHGQEHARHALEVALAGGHSLLLLGAAGTGKTLLLRTLPSLLPPLPDGTPRPIRWPHPATSPAAMVGNGHRPGEAQLAHRGVLVLDDLPAFRRATLSALKPLLTHGALRTVRGGRDQASPASCLLLAAMRTCPCGESRERTACGCTERAITRFRRRAWEILGSSFDLVVELTAPQVPAREWPQEGSARVAARIAAVRAIQRKRFGAGREDPTNGAMLPEELRHHCTLDVTGRAYYAESRKQLALLPNSLTRALRVARTNADLAGRETVVAYDLAQALAYLSNPLEELPYKEKRRC